jgi:hypothetical protein
MLKYHIQTIEVGSGGASTISFTGIPQIYDDLLLLTSVRTAAADDNLYVRFNGSTSGYSHRNLLGNGSTAFSQTQSNQQPGVQVHGMIGSTADTFGNGQVYVPNYRSSTSKSVSSEGVGEQNSTTGYQFLVAGLWTGTSAVDTLTLYAQGGGNFVQHSSASLYGIKRGSDGKTEVASGGVITTSGGYTIHTFNTSGTFVANRNLAADVLVIAGGGGGGSDQGGGGGAGGYIAQSVALAASSYAVTVGAGGTGMTASSGTTGSSGSNSVFSSITAIGGGRGGSGGTDNAQIGGSGGGGGAQVIAGAGASGTSGQGFAGANGSGTFANGGGGGGASEAGNTDGVRAGGDGVASSITGTSVVRAGGGSGGASNGTSVAGGDGGGGTGTGGNSTGGAGTANTGSGGGGGGSTPGVGNGAGGAGGSGVVIIRYLTPA